MSTPAAEAALNWLREHAPTPSNPHEAVALAVHAVLLHYDFRPSNTTTTDGAENTTATATTELPSDWGGAGYGGQYRHVRSAMLFDIRAVRMGGRLVVHAVAGEDDSRLNTVDVRVDNFYDVNNNNNNNNNNDNSAENSNVWDRLTDMNGLATLVAVQIAHRLVPEGSKQGYEDNAESNQQQQQQSSSSTSTAPTPTPVPGPRPFPPPLHDDHNDPLRIGPIRDPRFPLHPRQPPPLGHDDLLPAGLPQPGFPDGRYIIPNRNQGGNLMGPDSFNNNPNRRRPPGVPPGARFDPYGVNPDPDAEFLPGFEDDHRMRQGGRPSGPSAMFPRRGGGSGGMGDDGPPPGMFF